MVQGGVACLVNSPWAVLLLPHTLAVIRHRVVEKEERYLGRAFGDENRRYRARVRRWI
jgi:protein-S-isoprenylcysteine O-methyltransferase Ste14